MTEKSLHFDRVVNHYQESWKKKANFYLWDKGPIQKLPSDFRVLEFAPDESRTLWTYATCCMSGASLADPLEIHLFSPDKDEKMVEVLTAIAYYHNQTQQIGLNHTVNFGQPWKLGSECNHGLISLPYLDGPNLEELHSIDGQKVVKFYWLIPICEAEVRFKIRYGVDALEEKFENANFNYANPLRKCVV